MSYGRILSLLILSAIIIIEKLRLKPKFVVPPKNINQFNKILYQIIYRGICVLIILIPLNIKLPIKKEIQTTNSTNIEILLDVSLSMSADDIKPNRFQSAKDNLIKIIGNLTGYNISVITFSGIPFVYIPSSDQNLSIIDKIKNTNILDFPATYDFVGTALGDSILLGAKNIIDSQTHSGIILLITDGDSNKGYNPDEGIAIAQKNNIQIYTVGIGDGNFIIGKDKKNTLVTTDINRDLLKNISQKTGGKFYKITTDQDFQSISNELIELIKNDENTGVKIIYQSINRYLYYILIALVVGNLLIRFKILSKK